MGYNCLFTDVGVTVFRRSDDSIAFKELLKGKLYLVEFSNDKAKLDTCLIAKTNMGWLCHRRHTHVGMKNLHKLLKGEWKHLGPWLVLVINDNVILYVTNVCFAETNGKLGRITVGVDNEPTRLGSSEFELAR